MGQLANGADGGHLVLEQPGGKVADLIIVDQRGYPANLELAQDQPTWSSLTAAEAGTVAVWPAYWVRTYDDYAGALAELTAAIDAADDNLVP